MKPEPGKVRKPRGLTDEEWITILRVNGQTYGQYVFGSFYLVCICALVLTMLCVRCLTALPDSSLQWHFDWREDGILLWIIGFILLVYIGQRSYEWQAKRKIARAAGL